MSAANIETVTTSADKAKLALSVVLLVASVVGFYLTEAQGVWV